MKKLCLIISIGLLLTLVVTSGVVKATPFLIGDQVRISSLSNSVATDPNDVFGPSVPNGSGGLFTITNLRTNASIQTFCLELDEFVSLGQTYLVGDILDDVVWQGGRNTDSGDRISDATKWLYVQYLEGIYTNPSALQLAIWVLEDEYTGITIDDAFWSRWGSTSGSVGQTAKTYYLNAQGQSTTADIRALDLITASGNPVQSYIVRVSVPEPSTLLLLGAGLVGLGLFGRKRFRRKE